MANAALPTFKVDFVGAKQVGKTSLACYDTGEANTLSGTITREFDVDGQAVKLIISDIWTDPNYEDVNRFQYYQSTAAFLLVYSVTSPESLTVLPDILAEIQPHIRQDSIKMIVAAKVDEPMLSASIERAQQLATQIQAQLVITSCYQGTGVNEMYIQLARELLALHKPPEPIAQPEPTIVKKPKKRPLDNQKRTCLIM